MREKGTSTTPIFMTDCWRNVLKLFVPKFSFLCLFLLQQFYCNKLWDFGKLFSLSNIFCCTPTICVVYWDPHMVSGSAFAVSPNPEFLDDELSEMAREYRRFLYRHIDPPFYLEIPRWIQYYHNFSMCQHLRNFAESNWEFATWWLNERTTVLYANMKITDYEKGEE